MFPHSKQDAPRNLVPVLPTSLGKKYVKLQHAVEALEVLVALAPDMRLDRSTSIHFWRDNLAATCPAQMMKTRDKLSAISRKIALDEAKAPLPDFRSILRTSSES